MRLRVVDKSDLDLFASTFFLEISKLISDGQPSSLVWGSLKVKTILMLTSNVTYHSR